MRNARKFSPEGEYAHEGAQKIKKIIACAEFGVTEPLPNNLTTKSHKKTAQEMRLCFNSILAVNLNTNPIIRRFGPSRSGIWFVAFVKKQSQWHWIFRYPA